MRRMRVGRERVCCAGRGSGESHYDGSGLERISLFKMGNEPKTYPAPWDGPLLLACRKCQKKLKGHPDLHALGKLKALVKKRNADHPGRELHVLNVPCMDLCPKDGVTVCNPAKTPARLSILRSKKDVEKMFR